VLPTARIQRVALASDWFLPRIGGIELHLADLARSLMAKDVDVTVLTTTRGPASVEGIKVGRIATTRAPGFDFSISPLLVGKMVDYLRAGNFDVVHAHASVVSPAALATVIAARRLGLPVVVTFHSMLLRAADVLRWSDRIWRWSRHPILYTAVSSLVARQARSAVGDRKVIVLPNGVDLSAWSERQAREVGSNEKIVFATAMRLAPKKRPAALLDAFQIARKIASTYDRELELRIAGDGPLRSKLENLIARSGLSENVTLLGALSRLELGALYARADLFVMPSTRESFGLAALEARASGLPVVAMRDTGTDDFLENGKTALLARDDREFAAHMARLATDHALRGRLSGRDAGLIRFDWPGVAEQHLDAYRQAADLLMASQSGAMAGG
jgi:glycosyltransferase involved in cell wall biosynthesis